MQFQSFIKIKLLSKNNIFRVSSEFYEKKLLTSRVALRILFMKVHLTDSSPFS
jgi:hypothetical protein